VSAGALLLIVVVVLVPVALIVGGIWLGLALGRARADRRDADAARLAALAERDAAVAARDAEARRAADALAEAEAERVRVAEVQAEAEAARVLAEERGEDVAAASRNLDEAQAAVAAADARVQELQDRLGSLAREGGADPSLLLALELARSERRWRHSVATGPDQPSPFVGAADPVRVAVEVEVQALREESGALLELRWELADPLASAAALRVLRTAQEVAADAAQSLDEATLVVAPADGGVRVAVEPAPEEPLPSVVALGASGLVTEPAAVVVPT